MLVFVALWQWVLFLSIGAVLTSRLDQREHSSRWRLPLRWYRLLTVFTVICTWLLIVLGGLVRVTESGKGCGEHWPKCNGGYLPGWDAAAIIEWSHRLFSATVAIPLLLTVISTVLW